MLDSQYPGLQEFANNVALQYGLTEVIRQPLYDYQLYLAAGQLAMIFFQNPIGQGLSASPGNANNPKHLADTNMQAPGALPAPQAYFLERIEVDVDPGSVNTANTFTQQIPTTHTAVAAAGVQAGEADVNAIYSGGALTLTISTKPYWQEGPLKRFPPSRAFRLDSSITSNSATTAIEMKAKLRVDGEPCYLTPGVGIVTSQNFNVTLSWPAVIATPSGFNGRIGVILRGWLFRGVQ